VKRIPTQGTAYTHRNEFSVSTFHTNEPFSTDIIQQKHTKERKIFGLHKNRLQQMYYKSMCSSNVY